MAFDKLIIKSLTSAAKSGIRMDLALDSLKEKMIDNVSSKIENEIPIQLPFNVREVLLGGDLPTDLLTPEVINSVPKIPTSLKSQINNNLNIVEDTLNIIISQKNTLQGTLNVITTPLNTLETLSITINPLLTGLRTAVTVIKTLPIPTSVPPGVGIPVNIINGFSDALDTLGKVLDKFEGSLEIIPSVIQQINSILIPLIEKLSFFDPIFNKIIKIIAFIRLLLSLPKDGLVYQWDGTNWNQTTSPLQFPSNSVFGMVGDPNISLNGDFINQYYFDGNSSGGLTTGINSNGEDSSGIQQSDIDATLGNITNNIQKSLSITSPSNSNSNTNAVRNQALLDSLDPNSNNPLSYRGFRLTLEFDPNNTFSFPARRIKAYGEDDKSKGVTLYSVPPDQGSGEINTDSVYSFSTSIEVLVKEVKFQIDNYFIFLSRNDSITPKIEKIKRQRRKASDELLKLIQSRANFLLNPENQKLINEWGKQNPNLSLEQYPGLEPYDSDIERKRQKITQLQKELEYWELQLEISSL